MATHTTPTSDYQNAVALVSTGYHEPTRCLNFRVRFDLYSDESIACALTAVMAIGRYNEYDGKKVARALSPFMNDGGDGFFPQQTIIALEIGRQGSPVLFVTVHAESKRQAVEDALRKVGADELHWTNATLRAWFD